MLTDSLFHNTSLIAADAYYPLGQLCSFDYAYGTVLLRPNSSSQLSISPTTSAGDRSKGTVVFTVNPALPAGLHLDASGVIKGTIHRAQPQMVYKLTARNELGNITTDLRIRSAVSRNLTVVEQLAIVARRAPAVPRACIRVGSIHLPAASSMQDVSFESFGEWAGVPSVVVSTQDCTSVTSVAVANVTGDHFQVHHSGGACRMGWMAVAAGLHTMSGVTQSPLVVQVAGNKHFATWLMHCVSQAGRLEQMTNRTQWVALSTSAQVAPTAVLVPPG